MNIILALIYFLVLWIPMLAKRKDFFMPSVLFCITMSFYTIPDIVLFLIKGETFYATTLRFKLVDIPEIAIFNFLLTQMLFVLSYYLTFYLSLRKRSEDKYSEELSEYSKDYNLAIALSLISILASIYFIVGFGGVDSLLESFANRNKLVRNLPIVMKITPVLMTFASALAIKSIAGGYKHSKVLLALIIVGATLTYPIAGGRSQLVVFVISILFYYNYWIKKINLFSVRYLPLYGLLFCFIIGFHLLRFKETQELSLSLIVENSGKLFESMAYVPTQLLIQNYFKTHDFWWGAVYTFIPYIFIPRSLCPTKPNIDEGTYVFFMKTNRDNLLNSHADVITSWPPFTMGISYANWGIIGVILGGVVLGGIHAFMYNRLFKYRLNMFYMIVYIFVVLKFQMTVFYIANLIYLLIEIYIGSRIYKFYKKHVFWND